MTKSTAQSEKPSSTRATGLQFSKFAMVGVAGTVSHYIVLIALVKLAGMQPGRAAFAGASIGAIVVYLLNYRFTFASQRKHQETAPRFIVLAIVGALLNGALVGQLSGAGMHFLLAQLIATVLVLILNFVVSRTWIFQ
jgi:putative flippase GtrA